MRDLVSKFVLGFLMARFFPGALLVYALCFLYFSLPPTFSPSLYQELNVVLAAWETGSLVRTIVLIGICAGTGMLLHGLHRAVLASLESKNGSFLESPSHARAIWVQVLIGPWTMVREVFDLIFRTKGIAEARFDDPAAAIPPERFPHFRFVEEMDLYSSQFLVLTAYASLGCFLGLGTFVLFGGISLRRLSLLVLVWGAAGLFFVLGRIQLQAATRAAKALGTAGPD